jgi:hypothetical protein
MQRVEIGARVVAEVFHQILLRPPFVVLVPSRVQNKDVALANIGARALNHLRVNHRPVVHVL